MSTKQIVHTVELLYVVIYCMYVVFLKRNLRSRGSFNFLNAVYSIAFPGKISRGGQWRGSKKDNKTCVQNVNANASN